MASIAELAHGEKSRTQSMTQSPILFDAPGTEAFASEFEFCCLKLKAEWRVCAPHLIANKIKGSFHSNKVMF